MAADESTVFAAQAFIATTLQEIDRLRQDSGTFRDLESFNARIASWTKDVVEKVAPAFQRIVVADTFDRCVDGNPVGDPSTWKRPGRKGYVGGASRRAWVITINGGTAGNTFAALAGLKPGDRCSIANPSDYMEALNRGHSKQAPPGWIDKIVADVGAKYARVA